MANPRRLIATPPDSPAVLVVDMIRDNVHGPEHASITRQARAIVPRVNGLLAWAHDRGRPVIFACDSFQRQDPFFLQSRLKPHALQGTPGAMVIDELVRGADDLVLPKRRLSAFFGTGLDRTLHERGVRTVLICGITSLFCVLATAFDALSHDLSTIIVEDCCAAPRPELHEALLSCYRDSALRPMLQVLALDQLLALDQPPHRPPLTPA